LLADSEFTAGDITRVFGISRDRIRVIPLGVDPRMAPAPAGAVERLRRQYELTDSFVLYLGSGDTRKSLDTLIRSWFLTPPGRRPLLVMAGYIPCAGSALFPDYQQIADGLGLRDSIRFLGPVAEAVKPVLMSAADAFVCPSRYEGFGLEPLEAMACGTPVICSDRTSLPEVVGDAALLADPDEPHEWAERVSSVLGDSQVSKRLVDAGRTRAANFTWEKTASRTLAAYSELL
jgi:alpha-1,3-rhamnosyl/mannosyltransferase